MSESMAYHIAWSVFVIAGLFPLYDYYFGQPIEKQDATEGEA